MIIYREQRRRISTADILASLEKYDARDHDALRDLLIDFGELECGIADLLPPAHPTISELRHISTLIGRLFYRSCRGHAVHPVDLSIHSDVPHTIELSVPEGYAYYGLFPESYVNAAERFIRDVRPRECVVIGIRSIGTSLSAAVAGTIAESGVAVKSFTVRPSGHPFQRVTQIDRAIDPLAHYLVVDEGPGLSGSSFASVAEALSDAGVLDSHIFLFPSWTPDPAKLISSLARDRFHRHRSIVSDFNPAILLDDPDRWQDLSAGRWREVLCPGYYPAVHPQHERRKFLRTQSPQVLAKFVGLRRGKQAFERARSLYDSGFAPEPLKFSSGFLYSAFVPGQPVTNATPSLVTRIADYLNHILDTMPAAAPVPWNSLAEMLAINLEETLDVDASALLALRALIEDAPACELDGRMLPHEWIETPSGFLKTDAVDHYDDHFFPGPQDIAWDIAAACVEFSLDESFLSHFKPSIRKRVPFYLVAYSAFRLAYCLMAAKSVDPAEASRFRTLAARYESVIRKSSLICQPA